VTAGFAVKTGALPDGWRKTGEVRFTLKSGALVSIEVLSADGAVLESGPATAPGPHEFQELEVKALCRAGGVAGRVVKDVDDGVSIVDAIAPIKEDESADLTLLCTKPDYGDKQNPIQAYADLRLRTTWLLTSPTWRQWIARSGDATANAAVSERGATYKAEADEIETRTKGRTTPCWLATVLRQNATTQ
jgi:hypothetical protein